MACNVLCVGLSGNRPLLLALDEPTTVRDFKKRVSPQQYDELYLCNGGVPLSNEDVISASSGSLVLTAHYRLLGGKGGFGSLIRATGSHINKSSDKSACRDISGRRMRDIKKEKKIAEWMASEEKRKRERAEKRKRRLQKMLEEPRHKFEDSSYVDQIRSTEEGMADSLKQGLMQAEMQDDSAPGPSKKPKLWMPCEDLSSSESEDEESTPSPPLSTGEPDEPITTDDPTSSKEPAPEIDTQHASPKSNGNTQPVHELASPDPQPSTDASNTASAEADCEPVDLSQYSNVDDLLLVGGTRLKVSLQALGLKCGGTPLERAKRLFTTRDKSLDQLPRSFFAKNKGKK